MPSRNCKAFLAVLLLSLLAQPGGPPLRSEVAAAPEGGREGTLILQEVPLGTTTQDPDPIGAVWIPLRTNVPSVWQLNPGHLLSAAATRSRRTLKTALWAAMKSCGPDKASTAAAWLTDEGLEVLCDCTFAMALMSGAGPPAKPMRQPVMQ